MANLPEGVEFSRSDPRPLVARLRAIADRGDGEGWVNIGPALSDEEYTAVPPRSGLGAWFSGRGPVVPMATWMPPMEGDRPRPAQIGISHGTGPNALPRLEEVGLVLPATWTKKQDHAKHGIVAEIPDDADYSSMIDWLIRAMSHLSDAIPVGDRWIAEIHLPG
jgi:hypothetical protein